MEKCKIEGQIDIEEGATPAPQKNTEARDDKAQPANKEETRLS
jgi:hypothetical protein